MKKHLLSLAFLIFFLGLGLGLSGIAQDASAILRESNARFSMLQDFSAEFVYSIENPTRLNSNVSKTGKLFYSKGKYVVKMPDQEIYTDGKSLWIHVIEMNELNIMDYDPEDGLGVEQMFTFSEGHENNARYEGQKVVGGRPLDQINVLVNNPGLDFNQGLVWINAETKLTEKIILINRMQTRTTFEFSNIVINQSLPDGTFVFNLKNFRGDVYDEREVN
jgi:outer membrane lipoprotein-sorting protein